MNSISTCLLFIFPLVQNTFAVPHYNPPHCQANGPCYREREPRSFIVPRVPNANFQGHNGPKQLLKTYQKYGMPVPEGLETAAEAHNVRLRKKRQEHSNHGSTAGSVPANPTRDRSEYVSPILIGGQSIVVDFDTGSADLWAFSSHLDEKLAAGHQVYNDSQSESFKLIEGSFFNVSYGDGSTASGPVGTEMVEVGGIKSERQVVGLATTISHHFVQDTANNGILGLAFSKLNSIQPEKQKTFFENVVTDLAEPVFTADLRRPGSDPGSYEFGKVDESKYRGSMAWAPINRDTGFWQVSSESFAIGGAEGRRRVLGEGTQVVADTGTSIILARAAVVEAYYAAVEGARNDIRDGGYVLPCDAEVPDLRIDVGGVFMASIPGRDIIFTQYSDTMCYGGLQASTSKLQVLGDIFFNSHFVAFHGGNYSLGIAERA